MSRNFFGCFRKSHEHTRSWLEASRKPGKPRGPQEAQDHPRGPRELPGARRKLQDVTGDPRRHQEFAGYAKRRQKAAGTFENAPGIRRTPQATLGSPRTPPRRTRQKLKDSSGSPGEPREIPRSPGELPGPPRETLGAPCRNRCCGVVCPVRDGGRRRALRWRRLL